MANLVQTLIPILLLAAAANPALSQILPSSTSFFYDFTRPQSTGLTFLGEAVFPPNSTSLRLTTPRTAVFGRVLYTHPVQFSQPGGRADFETTFTFLIRPGPPHPTGGNAADGLVFFIAPVSARLSAGVAGAGFAVFDAAGQNPVVFAVEFDTYSNGAWDPNDRHIGIDLGSWKSRNTTKVGNAIVGQQVTAKINYVAATKMISVVAKAGWQTFEVSYKYDLSTFLPQKVQVGLSASTGLVVSTHEVMSWHFTSTMVAGGCAADGREVV